MEPRIQYAKTEDGVSIAYWTLGEGEPPLVLLPEAFTHTQLEWQIPEIRGWYERLAEKRKLVRYDLRGTGLSERDVADLPADWQRLDLEAVVGRLELERFALFASVHAGPAAIMYTVDHPERVSHLVLWCAYARGADWVESSEVQATRAMIDKDWNTYTEAVAYVVFGWSAGEQAQRFAALVRESATPEIVLMATRALSEVDVTGLLSEVRSPTLVLHRRQLSLLSVDVARSLASRIPQARLAVLEGELRMPFLGDTQAVLDAIGEFLGEGEEPAERSTARLPEGTAVILFVDIADSTALTTQLGDAAYRERERELDASLRSAIREAGGTPVEGKVLGDGVMAVFTSARQAIECALRCRAEGESAGLPLHLGIHAGDVVREGNNVHGGAVQLAARVQSAAAPGEILVSDIVRGLARTSSSVQFEDRGERELKGIAEPQRLYSVKEQS